MKELIQYIEGHGHIAIETENGSILILSQFRGYEKALEYGKLRLTRGYDITECEPSLGRVKDALGY